METKKTHSRVQPAVIDTKKIAFNADTRREFLGFVKHRGERLEEMLLWCSIFVLLSYVALVLSIIKCYASLTSQQPVYLALLLVLVVVMLVAFIILQYRHAAYRPLSSTLVIKELLNFKIHVANRQLKLLSGYIIAYSVIVGGSCLLCWYSAGQGAAKILALTAPISIMVYGAGLFLLAKLLVKRRAYLNYICAIDEGILKQFNKQ